MSSGWFPPREDSPSVLSNRVFSIRRLNKMEAQRLGSQLNNLDAEKAQTQALISQEQKALIKELTQIREIKDNSAVSSERRKLLQQTSSKESQLMCRHHLTGETVKQQATHTRFRSLSSGQCPPTQCSHLPSLNGRQRSLSTTCPPLLGREELPGTLRCKESGSLQDVNNNTAQKDYDMYTSRNEKLRQRSLSTGTCSCPRTSAWAGGKSEFEVSSYTKVEDWHNHGVSQDYLGLEFKQTPKAAREEMRRDTQYGMNKDTLSRPKLNSSNGSYVCDRRQTEGISSTDELSKLAPMRRVRSYSTNSAPIISEGRVVGLGAASKTTIVPQRFDTANQRRTKHSTSFAPKVNEGEEHHGDGSNENTAKNAELQRIPLLSTARRRHRSLSTNCPPAVIEGIVVEDENNNEKLNLKTNTEEKRKDSLNDETKERNISTKHIVNDKDFDESRIDHSDCSVPRDPGRDGKEHKGDISLPALQ